MLLRDVARGLLPDAVLDRAPYVRAKSLVDGRMTARWLSLVLKDSQQPVHRLLSRKAENALLQGTSGYEKTHLPVFLLQLNFWLKQYDIEISL